MSPTCSVLGLMRKRCLGGTHKDCLDKTLFPPPLCPKSKGSTSGLSKEDAVLNRAAGICGSHQLREITDCPDAPEEPLG